MYIESLRIRNLKLLKDFSLSFTNDEGEPRMWTVIIGENGTGKTSILQAIAMAAAGSLQINSLAKPVVGQLRDRRTDDAMAINAEFRFTSRALEPSVHPLLTSKPTATLRLDSSVSLVKGETTLKASSRYVKTRGRRGDPLDTARSQNQSLWFVAGYGVARLLPDAGRPVSLAQPSIERMSPLFDQTIALTSTGFANYFEDQPDKARRFHRVLKRTLKKTEELLPAISDLELRGRGGVRKAGDLQERDRFIQRVGKQDLKVPATALSHGYQSTIAWIADLIGHVVLEADNELEPEYMEGLVLIDELDLYLHPTWQVHLVRALRETFPRMQFVATTHSPLVLAGLRPDKDDIVRLSMDPKEGNIERVPVDADPRLMTGTEIYKQFFGIDDVRAAARARSAAC